MGKTKKKNTSKTVSAEQSVGYKGTVTIKYMSKGKHKSLKAHNSGTIKLFTLLTKIIAGDVGLLDSMPYYIMAYNKESDTSITELLRNKVYISTTPIRLDSSGKKTTGSSSKVQLQFILPYGLFIDASKDINYLELKDSNDNVCATLDLATAISDYASSNLMISWVLSFSNN